MPVITLATRLKHVVGLFLITVGVVLGHFFTLSVLSLILAVLLEPSAILPGTILDDTGLSHQFQVVATLVAIAISLLFMQVWFALCRLRLKIRWFSWRDIWVVVKYSLIHFGVLLLIVFVFNWLQLESDPQREMIQQEQFAAQGVWLTVLLVVVAVPLFEEVLFRAFFFAGLRRVGGFWFAFFISGLLFTFLHLDLSAGWEENASIFAIIFSLSYFMTKAFEETDNLAVPILFHSLHNLRAVIITYVALNDVL